MKHSGEYWLGLICGMASGVIFVALAAWIIRKIGGKFGGCGMKKKTYDERQLLARGKAYKNAFFTLIIYFIVAGTLYDFLNIRMLMSFGGLWIGICISVGVFAITCILKDAYMNLYENAKGIMMLFLVGVLNIAISILNKVSLLEEGVVSLESINLIAGILFLVISAVFFGREIYNKKQLGEDEE